MGAVGVDGVTGDWDARFKRRGVVYVRFVCGYTATRMYHQLVTRNSRKLLLLWKLK